MTDQPQVGCRDKLQASEGKLRSAIQDKANVVSEKAAIDRQLKALQAQTGKLTKVIDGLSAQAGLDITVQPDASSFAWPHNGCITSKCPSSEAMTSANVTWHSLPRCTNAQQTMLHSSSTKCCSVGLLTICNGGLDRSWHALLSLGSAACNRSLDSALQERRGSCQPW